MCVGYFHCSYWTYGLSLRGGFTEGMYKPAANLRCYFKSHDVGSVSAAPNSVQGARVRLKNTG